MDSLNLAFPQNVTLPNWYVCFEQVDQSPAVLSSDYHPTLVILITDYHPLQKPCKLGCRFQAHHLITSDWECFSTIAEETNDKFEIYFKKRSTPQAYLRLN